MKLRAVDTRPSQTLRVTLDAPTHDKLTAYLEYAATQGQHFADSKQLLAEIVRAFLDDGDKNLTHWYRARQMPTTAPATTINGSGIEGAQRVMVEPVKTAGRAKEGTE